MKHETIILTAEQLGIHPDTHVGLRQLAEDLETGRIEHMPGHDPERDARGAPTRAFNMAHGCGTACCIAGWLEARSQLPGDVRLYVRDSPLFDLCHPLFRELPTHQSRHDTWDAITPLQSATAIRNFLASGDARWGEVLGVSS